MAVQNNPRFDGATSLTDIHDSMQTEAGNATWAIELLPVVETPERKIAEVILWSFHKLDLCCCIVGEFAMYIAGRTPTHSGCITIYIGYHPAELTPDSSILFQITRAPAFSLNSLDFLLVPEFTIPGSVIYYIVKYGDTTMAVKIDRVYCNVPCGPRSNLNLVHYLWSEFVYYCSNYGLFVLPSLTSGEKLICALL
jgi:hypothetical protein